MPKPATPLTLCRLLVLPAIVLVALLALQCATPTALTVTVSLSM